MNSKKLFALALTAALGLTGLTACKTEAPKPTEPTKAAAAKQTEAPKKPATLKKVDFILDWVPNTNHTGLYVAREKGYLAEVGIDLDIKQPPEESTSDLIINNKAPFGIYFQDSMSAKLSKGAPLVAVAAIIEHNISGIIGTEKSGIKAPQDMPGKRYGTWNDPVELAMIQTLVEAKGGKFADIKLVPNTGGDSISAMENDQFDSAWIYYGWDGILSKTKGHNDNFFYMKDFSPELDFYSPVIISNKTYLKENPEEAKKILAAIKKGYQYAMEHPKEAADILIKNAPELEAKKEFIYASQEFLSKNYASKAEDWGKIDPVRWNTFYKWVNAKKIAPAEIPENAGFSNDYLN